MAVGAGVRVGDRLERLHVMPEIGLRDAGQQLGGVLFTRALHAFDDGAALAPAAPADAAAASAPSITIHQRARTA